jgi:hypothetical protein
VSAAPDFIDPTVGWRTWLVMHERGGLRLRSIMYDALWLPRNELVARCLQRGVFFPSRRRCEHVPPARGCRCGIYAASEPALAASYLEGRSWADALGVYRVIGTVSLWGRVVECTRGWRAARAYPKRIYVPAICGRYSRGPVRAEQVALALTAYAVPVELLETDSGTDEVVAALGARAAHG